MGTLRPFSANGTLVGCQFCDLAFRECSRSEHLGLHSLFGLGFTNLMLGGMTLCSNDKTHLIKLFRPEEPSEWPTFGFTDPMYTPFSPKTLPTAPTSIGSPVEVPVPWH